MCCVFRKLVLQCIDEFGGCYMSNAEQSRLIRIENMIAQLNHEQRRVLALVLFEKRAQNGLNPFEFLFWQPVSKPQQSPVRQIGGDTC